MVGGQAARLVNGIGNIFLAGGLLHIDLLIVLGLANHLVKVLIFYVLWLLATIVSVVDFASL